MKVAYLNSELLFLLEVLIQNVFVLSICESLGLQSCDNSFHSSLVFIDVVLLEWCVLFLPCDEYLSKYMLLQLHCSLGSHSAIVTALTQPRYWRVLECKLRFLLKRQQKLEGVVEEVIWSALALRNAMSLSVRLKTLKDQELKPFAHIGFNSPRQASELFVRSSYELEQSGLQFLFVDFIHIVMFLLQLLWNLPMSLD